MTAGASVEVACPGGTIAGCCALDILLATLGVIGSASTMDGSKKAGLIQ